MVHHNYNLNYKLNFHAADTNLAKTWHKCIDKVGKGGVCVCVCVPML